MLHFIMHAEGVADTPFGAELGRLRVLHRFWGGYVDLRYKTTAGLLLRVYPRLAWFALNCAVRSLLLSRPAPAAAIVGSDVEALVFGCLRRVFRPRTLLVFHTVIISRASNPIFRRYYAMVLSLVDVAICHSSVEVERYAALFPEARCRFVFIPYRTTVTRRAALMACYAVTGAKNGMIVAAGRSGRDYRTLVAAIRGLPCKLRIICDMPVPAADDDPSAQISVSRDTFDETYLEQLANALFVVVPLATDDKSAGQMVALQAAALNKAIIVTRTAAIAEYVTDGQDALLVERNDVAQMRAAIRRLLEDDAFRARLGANAAIRFEREHSTEAFVRKLLAAVTMALTHRSPVAAGGSNDADGWRV